MGDLFDILLFFLALAAGYFSGSLVEKRHYQSIKERESKLLNLAAVTSENLLDENRLIKTTQFVHGNIVISTDYFKLIFSGLRSFLGGRISAYETLVDRARREAILRMKEMAKDADIILNLRVETSLITQTGSVEAFAYGTAVYYQK